MNENGIGYSTNIFDTNLSSILNFNTSFASSENSSFGISFIEKMKMLLFQENRQFSEVLSRFDKTYFYRWEDIQSIQYQISATRNVRRKGNKIDYTLYLTLRQSNEIVPVHLLKNLTTRFNYKNSNTSALITLMKNSELSFDLFKDIVDDWGEKNNIVNLGITQKNILEETPELSLLQPFEKPTENAVYLADFEVKHSKKAIIKSLVSFLSPLLILLIYWHPIGGMYGVNSIDGDAEIGISVLFTLYAIFIFFRIRYKQRKVWLTIDAEGIIYDKIKYYWNNYVTYQLVVKVNTIKNKNESYEEIGDQLVLEGKFGNEQVTIDLTDKYWDKSLDEILDEILNAIQKATKNCDIQYLGFVKG